MYIMRCEDGITDDFLLQSKLIPTPSVSYPISLKLKQKWPMIIVIEQGDTLFHSCSYVISLDVFSLRD